MSDLVSNVLDLMRFQSGQVRAAARLADARGSGGRSARAAARSGCRTIRVELRLPPDLPPVYVDAGLVVQLFANLLDNIAKYTPPGTRFLVSARRMTGDAVRVIVEDEGPGFPAGDPAKLFEKFQRGNEEGAVVGAGLGTRDLPRHRARARRGDRGAPAARAAARGSNSRCRRRSRRRDRGDASGPGHRGRARHPQRAQGAVGGRAVSGHRGRHGAARRDRDPQPQAGPVAHRSRTARRRWPDGDSQGARLVSRSDRRSLGAHHGGTEDRGARRRRRRLRHQAFQRAGAARPGPRGAAPQRARRGEVLHPEARRCPAGPRQTRGPRPGRESST